MNTTGIIEKVGYKTAISVILAVAPVTTAAMQEQEL